MLLSLQDATRSCLFCCQKQKTFFGGNKMISKDNFNRIVEKASGYRYSSMLYIDFDDCKNSEILHDGSDFILMQDKSKTPNMLHFAANDFDALTKKISKLQGVLRMNFVPKECADKLGSIGFTEWGEFLGFWNYDIAKTVASFDDLDEHEYLDINDCGKASAISKKCTLQSRGFEGDSPEWFKEWIEEGNKVIILRMGSEIAGICCVAITNNGTTLWIREIVVEPRHQGMGLGKKLFKQALEYGVQNGAAKAFLMVDRLNANAINIYNKYGLYEKEGDSELQMIKRVNSN